MEHSAAGTICPVCQAEIKQDDPVTVCPACGTAHHTSCWERSGGCAAPDCPQHQASSFPAQVCAACGAPIGQDQAFCSKCGAPRQGTPGKCAGCGTPLEPGQAFCSKCGRPAGVPAQGAVPPVGRPATPPRKSPAKFIVIALAAVVVIGVLIYLFGPGKDAGQADNGPDFQKLYDQYCSSLWAELGEDGSYLYIDTNPEDNEDDGLAYIEAYTAVEEVNDALGLPDSLYSDMGETTGADGKQTEEFDEQNLTVSWRYHPDRGLEVTYKKNH